MPVASEPWWSTRLLDYFTPGVDTNSVSPEVLSCARRHRVELALLDRLAAERRSTDELDDYRRSLAMEARARRLRAAQVVSEIMAITDRPIVVVKGPATAQRWYENPDHRPFGDLDLLVRRTDLVRTLGALEANGAKVLLENWRGFLRHGIGELPVQWGDIVVDLHWDLVALATDRRSLRFDIDAMVERSVPLVLPGVEARTLDDTDTLLHHCTNTGLGGARRWGQLVDVGLIAEQGDIDVDTLASRAASSGVGALCAAVLQRSHILAGAPVPDEWIARLEPWTPWAATNRVMDTTARRRRMSDSVAPGFWLASGRQDPRATAAAAAGELTKAWHRFRGRSATTRPGGELNWFTTAATADNERTSYLDWVAKGEGLRVSRTADASALDSALGPLEPRSTPTLGLASRVIDRGGGCIVTVDAPDGSVAAVIAVDQWHPIRRAAYPVILDPVAARVVAEQIDLLGITELAGFDVDIDALRPLVRRWGPVTPGTPVALPYGAVWESPSPTTRAANHNDLDRITDLLWQHAVHGYVRRRQLKRRLRSAIDDLVLVAETDGVVTGLAVRESTTPRFHYWSTMLVEPGARGAGQSWELISAIIAEAFAAGAGALGFGAASNPMPAPSDSLVGGTWLFVELRPPNRWPGERRIRRYTTVVEGWLQRTPDPRLTDFRRPGADDERITDRRTQSWWSERSERADESNNRS